MDGVERVYIRPQARHVHQGVGRVGSICAEAEPLSLLQHEGDQGAEHRDVGGMLPCIFDAQKTGDGLPRFAHQGEHRKMPGAAGLVRAVCPGGTGPRQESRRFLPHTLQQQGEFFHRHTGHHPLDAVLGAVGPFKGHGDGVSALGQHQRVDPVGVVIVPDRPQDARKRSVQRSGGQHGGYAVQRQLLFLLGQGPRSLPGAGRKDLAFVRVQAAPVWLLRLLGKGDRVGGGVPAARAGVDGLPEHGAVVGRGGRHHADAGEKAQFAAGRFRGQHPAQDGGGFFQPAPQPVFFGDVREHDDDLMRGVLPQQATPAQHQGQAGRDPVEQPVLFRAGRQFFHAVDLQHGYRAVPAAAVGEQGLGHPLHGVPAVQAADRVPLGLAADDVRKETVRVQRDHIDE